MRRWKQLGLERRLGSCIVTYADDLVILCKWGRAAEPLTWLRAIMGKLKLTVNEDKTRICTVPADHFDSDGAPVSFGGRLVQSVTDRGLTSLSQLVHFVYH